VNKTIFRATLLAVSLMGLVPTMQMLVNETQPVRDAGLDITKLDPTSPEAQALLQKTAQSLLRGKANDPSTQVRPSDTAVSGRNVRLTADRSGHFHTKLYLDDHPAEAMVDTGATIVALTYETAQRMRLPTNRLTFNAPMSTANGIAMAAPVTLRSVRLGTLEVKGVRAVVMPKGALSNNLLGMSFLSRLGKVEMADGRLLLIQ
jgi:aspartyl protease family protein